MNLDLQWLVDMGATPAEAFIFTLGMLFAAFVVWRDRQNRADAILRDQQLRADMHILWEEIRELQGKYGRLDTLGCTSALAIYFISKSIDGMPTIELIKQSADGDGNYTLNRDQWG